MPTVTYKSLAQFAKMCSVSRSAITQANDRGDLFISRNGKIDPAQKKNNTFLRNHLARVENEEREKENAETKVKKTRKRAKPKGGKKVAPSPRTRESMGVTPTKIDVEIARIQAQTTKINMDIAEKMGRFFLREEVEGLFGKLSTTFSNLIHPLGQRLAPDICDICGITDSAKMIEVQNLLERELEIAVNEVKRLAKDVEKG